jgi:hypothetical protein
LCKVTGGLTTNTILCFSHQLSSSRWKYLNILRVTFTTSQCSLAYEFTQVEQNNGIILDSTISPPPGAWTTDVKSTIQWLQKLRYTEAMRSRVLVVDTYIVVQFYGFCVCMDVSLHAVIQCISGCLSKRYTATMRVFNVGIYTMWFNSIVPPLHGFCVCMDVSMTSNLKFTVQQNLKQLSYSRQ